MKQKKNQGFTLVELLVSIAVLSIVTLGIGGLLRLAAEQYSNATKETEVQNILQQTVASVSNTMEDAELGVFFSGNTLTIANRNKYFKFERVGNVLYYDEKRYLSAVDDEEKIDEAKGGSVGHNQENVLADHITIFTVSIPEVLPGDKQGFAVLTVGIQFQERGKSIVQNVFFRNYNAEVFQVSSTLAGGGSPIPGGGGGGGTPAATPTQAGPTALPGDTPTPTPSTAPASPTPFTASPTPITPGPGGGGGGGGGGTVVYNSSAPGAPLVKTPTVQGNSVVFDLDWYGTTMKVTFEKSGSSYNMKFDGNSNEWLLHGLNQAGYNLSSMPQIEWGKTTYNNVDGSILNWWKNTMGVDVQASLS